MAREVSYVIPSSLMMSKTCTALSYHIPLVIGGVAVEALVDTGATVTLASASLIKSIPGFGQLMGAPSIPCVTGVGGSNLVLLGEINVPITVGSFSSAPHRILVVDESSGVFPFILGLDFLDKHYLVVDTSDRSLKYKPPHGESFSIDVRVTQQNLADCRVLCSSATLIKSRCSQFVAVEVPGAGIDSEGCIEPILGNKSVALLAHSVNIVVKGKTYLEVLNPSQVDVKFEKGQHLANFVPILEGVCSFVDSQSKTDAHKLFDLTDTDLTVEQKCTVRKLLSKHLNVIGEDESDIGCTPTVTHHIDVQNARPVKQKYRRFATPLREEIQSEVDSLLQRGIIEPSNSAWASPLVPVRKKNGKLRICVDFRAVNSLTRKDSFPLPNLADAVGRFKDNMYFSSLDLLAGYHQIPLAESSKEITAFSTGEQLYQYTRMPFGVTNGPASFSRLVSVVLSGVPLERAQAYLDDILVAGKDFEDHLRNLDGVLSRLGLHGLKLAAAKCELFRSEVKYLGHVVGRNGIRPLTSNVDAIVNFPQPKSVKQVKSFNGMVNFYKRFIRNSADIMKPLYDCASQKILRWTEECARAFESVKRCLAQSPILAYPDFSPECSFYLTTDASATGAGAVLSQLQDGEERVIGYAGVSFNRAQTRYSTTDRELAAIRFGVRHFKYHLYGRQYTIRTDHRPLIYLNNMKRLDDRLLRTMEDLAVGYYEVEYVPGNLNVVADCLSRAEYPWQLPDEPVGCESLPRSGEESYSLVRMTGGPNSLFEALSFAVSGEVGSAARFREETVDAIRVSPVKYGFSACADGRKKINLLYSSCIFPPFEVLQAFADEFGRDVVIDFDGDTVVRVRSASPSDFEVRLRCAGGVHFDCLRFDGFSNVEPSEGKVSDSVDVDENSGSLEQPIEGEGSCFIVQSLINLTCDDSDENIRKHQSSDDTLKRLKAIIVDPRVRGEGHTWTKELACYKPWVDKLILVDDLVKCRVYAGNRPVTVALVPECQILHLSRALHELLNHAGRDKVCEVMRRKYFNPQFAATIAKVVKECTVCQYHKGSSINKYPLYRRQTSRPYETYAVDLMELPKSKSGFTCILVGIDLYSKYAHVVSLRSKTSKMVSAALESHVLASVPKTPESILSDNGPEFRGQAFQQLLQRYGINHRNSVPYAPHTNGCVERLNRTIKSRLSAACHLNTEDWDKRIYSVIAQYNRTPHSETGRAPVEFFLDESPKLNIPAKSSTWKEHPQNFRKFEVGALVMRRVPYQAAGQRNKLAPRFDGPYKIVTADENHVTYQIRKCSGGRTIKVHISQLKKFYGELEVATEVNSGCKRNSERSTKTVKLGSSPKKVLGINWEALKFLPIGPEPRCDETVSLTELSELPLNLDNEIGSWELAEDLEPELPVLQPRASTPNWAENLFHDSEIGQDFEGFHNAEVEQSFFGFTVIPPTPPLLAQRRNQDSQSAISELRAGTSLDNVCLAAHSEILQSQSYDVNDSANFMPMASFELEQAPDVAIKTRRKLDCCCT